MGVDSWPTGGPAVHRADPVRRGRAGAPAASDYYANPAATNQRSNGRVPPTTALPQSPAAGTGSAARHRVHRVETPTRSGGPLGDRRGLTTAGALVLLLVFGGVGAGLDRLLGHGLWILFSVGFVAAVLVNALRIHLEDLAASIVLVPISYAVVGAFSSLLASGWGQGLRQETVNVAGVLIFGAPILVLSVLVALAVAGARARAATVARRRARIRATRRYGALPPGSRPRRSSGAVARRSR